MATEEQLPGTDSGANEQATPLPPVTPSAIPPPPPQQQFIDPTKRKQYSNIQPVWQFILLNLCTFTLYHYVWFYWNWYLLKTERRLRVTPLARTIFAPLFSWSFFSEVQQLVGSKYSWPLGFAGPPLMATAYSILMVTVSILNRLERINDEFTVPTGIVYLLGFAAMLPLIPAVRALNAYWAYEQPDRPIRNSLSAGAIVTVIIGGLLFLVVLLGVVVNIMGLA